MSYYVRTGRGVVHWATCPAVRRIGVSTRWVPPGSGREEFHPGCLPRGPECRQGKHDNCNGDAWDNDRDEPTPCTCFCHPRCPSGCMHPKCPGGSLCCCQEDDDR